MRTWWSSTATLEVLGILLLGQLVSFLLALMSITSSLIAQFGWYFYFVIFFLDFKRPHGLIINDIYIGVDTPLTQSLFTYGSLALVYGSILLYRHQKPLVCICIYISSFYFLFNIFCK
jgi:solute carrier family 35, member F1/2